MRDKITDTVDTARPYVERLARDEELHDHVKKARPARKIYDELIGPSGPSGMAFKGEGQGSPGRASRRPSPVPARPAPTLRARPRT